MLFDLDEISALERDIKRHNKLYWEDQNPEISDVEYDLLIERLRALNPQSEVLNALVEPVSSDKEIRHKKPMLSLGKCYDQDGLSSWLQSAVKRASEEIIASPKIDGVACSLVYDAEGSLRYASTRGDGVKGESITSAVQTMDTIPKSIPAQGREIEIRGEIYMSLTAFQASTGLKSPRNACAGAIKRKEAQDNQAFGLRFYAYDVDGLDRDTLSDALDLVSLWGFSPVPYTTALSNDKDALTSVYDDYEQGALNRALDYDIDGVVYRVNRIETFNRLGSTSHHPRGAIAYKLKGDSAVTTLREIEWSVSRSGVLTPVGIFDPILLNGASVSRVTLHNLNFIREKNIYKLDSRVKITRSGGVIPYFEEVVTRGKRALNLPVSCPTCPSREGCRTLETDGILRCDGDQLCDPIMAQVLKHYVKTTKIDGFGDVWLNKLVSLGILKTPVDLYTLTEKDLQGLEGVGEVRIKGWLDSIDKSRSLDLDVFLRALSVEYLGRSLSAVLASTYKSIDKILEGLSEKKITGKSRLEHELSLMEGMGNLSAFTACSGLNKKIDLIKSLREHVNVLDFAERKSSSDKLSGQSFVFTGTMISMKRSEAQNKVKDMGGTCPSSVSKTLTYLVVGDEGKAGSKLDKAKKLDVSILSEKEFNELLNS